jgi:hypothetical protein
MCAAGDCGQSTGASEVWNKRGWYRNRNNCCVPWKKKGNTKVAGQYVGQGMLFIQPVDTSTSYDMLLPLRSCGQSSRCLRPMHQLLALGVVVSTPKFQDGTSTNTWLPQTLVMAGRHVECQDGC